MNKPVLQPLPLCTADGHRIMATRYLPASEIKATLIVAGAIGVPQRYYRHFAAYAASMGYAVLTLDYRGIALSAPDTLKNFSVNCLDWGRQDLAAVVTFASSLPGPLYMVAHSFGGHAFGLLPNASSIRGLFTFGTGAGWHGWMPPLERIRVLAMWYVLGPLLTARDGYLSWSTCGLGEDLPLDSYRQWKRWCRHRNFFLGESALAHLKAEFAAIRVPIVAANSLDDRWSPPRSRDAFISAYESAALTTMDIAPAQVGLRNIGHMGYFKPEARALWEIALHWLDTV